MQAAASAWQLPVVVYARGDLTAREALKGSHKFMHVVLDRNAPRPRHDKGLVLLTSSERGLREVWEGLRGDTRLRVVALSDERFRDPRLDGAVYGYLPPGTPMPLVERMVENALGDIHLASARQDFNQRLADAWREIDELNRIGVALSAEHDTDKLLEMILSKSRQITVADAGSLYLVESSEGKRHLRFTLLQNDSVAVPFREAMVEISPQSIAGYVALTGQTVNIEDAYNPLPELPYRFNRSFDEASGYCTRSILAVPMRNAKGEVLGVVQLLNSKRSAAARLDSKKTVGEQVVPFTERHRDLAASLASQAAVALENSRLVESIQRLFEGFVRASITAVEERDPSTYGHSFRVSNLTLALAAAGERAGKLRFSREQMKELRYASLLHEFGKVGVREEVLVKAHKLDPLQMDVVRQRLQLARCAVESENLRARLEFLLQHERREYLEAQARFDDEIAEQLRELETFWQTIQTANIPTLQPEGGSAQLADIASRYVDVDGQRQPLLDARELRLLSIRKGSLDEEERRQMESHVEHTYRFLSQIPWTEDIRGVPAIARAHHEKLNGHGYPHGLLAAQIPVQARLITISDIFDGLTSSDRPYKQAVSTERALQFLQEAAESGELDPELVRLFVEAKVYQTGGS